MKWREKIIADNCSTLGTITEIKLSSWFKDHPQSELLLPRKILYTYAVEGIDYNGYHYIAWEAPSPQIGDKIKVYYQAAAPHRNAAVMPWEEVK